MISSVSRLKLFKSCRRAYYFKYMEGLLPVEKSNALQTGTSYHAKLESLYKNGNFERDFSKESAMATVYEKYIYPKFKVDRVEDFLRTEIGGHTLIGICDGIASDGSIVEHKTTSQEITEAYEYNLLWDEQILAYMTLTGARKVYYTVIRKPTIRQKKNESEEEFFNRMVEWYDTDTDSKIRLLEITRTDEEVDAFKRDFVKILDIMQDADESSCYRNTQHCNCWGRRCEYSSICLNYNPNQTYVEFYKKEE